MTENRTVSNCRWAVPTLGLPAPLWPQVLDFPWGCVRDEAPRLVENAQACADCPRWQPAVTSDALDAPGHSEERDR